jgi:hypothetical protein
MDISPGPPRMEIDRNLRRHAAHGVTLLATCDLPTRVRRVNFFKTECSASLGTDQAEFGTGTGVEGCKASPKRYPSGNLTLPEPPWQLAGPTLADRVGQEPSRDRRPEGRGQSGPPPLLPVVPPPPTDPTPPDGPEPRWISLSAPRYQPRAPTDGDRSQPTTPS